MSGRTLDLAPAVFVILAALIEERLGLFYSAADAELLAEKVSPRAVERGFDSLLDYYYFLRYDAGADVEIEALAETLVVNETYFAREADQVTALVDQLLPKLLQARGRVRLWSAACSTGEEPLTLCGMLSDRGLLPQVDVVASDLSPRALKLAQRGKFTARSLRALPAMGLGWFDFEGPTASIKRELAVSVRWHQINLNDDARVAGLGRFDVILCRNVLIYFRDATIVSVVRNLERSLVPGGYLLVGASESLLRFGSGLSCEEHGGAFFYRKAGP